MISTAKNADHVAERRRLLTLQRLADEWAVSLSTLRRIIARGELSVIRIGEQIRVEPAEAERYRNRHRV